MRTFLVLAPLLLFSACIRDTHASYYYASDLGDEGRQAWFWPGDAEGESFRCVVQAPGRSLEEFGDDSSAEVLRIGEVERIEALAARIDGATVLVPESALAGVRSRADALLAAIAKANARLATHVVFCDQPLATIDGARDLAPILRSLRSTHAEARPASFGQVIGSMIGKAWTMQSVPNYILVPLAGEDPHFAVVGDLRGPDGQSERRALALAEIVLWITPRLADEKARTIHVDWGTNTSRNGGSMMMTKAGAVLLAVLVPGDATAEVRARCEELARALEIDSLAPIVIARVPVCWTSAELATLEHVAARVPDIPDWSFVTGHVRQTAVLPKPEPLHE